MPRPPVISQALQSALQRFINSPAFKMGARGLTVLVALGVILLASWLALRRMRRAPATGIEEVRESVLSGELLWGQIKNLFRRRKRRPATPAPPYLALSDPDDDPRLIVRRAYQAMLEWAASFSLPRIPRQTPAMYAEALSGARPEARDSIRALTEVYARARYGGEPPSLEEARRVERAVERLRGTADERR